MANQTILSVLSILEYTLITQSIWKNGCVMHSAILMLCLSYTISRKYIYNISCSCWWVATHFFFFALVGQVQYSAMMPLHEQMTWGLFLVFGSKPLQTSVCNDNSLCLGHKPQSSQSSNIFHSNYSLCSWAFLVTHVRAFSFIGWEHSVYQYCMS